MGIRTSIRRITLNLKKMCNEGIQGTSIEFTLDSKDIMCNNMSIHQKRMSFMGLHLTKIDFIKIKCQGSYTYNDSNGAIESVLHF